MHKSKRKYKMTLRTILESPEELQTSDYTHENKVENALACLSKERKIKWEGENIEWKNESASAM